MISSATKRIRAKRSRQRQHADHRRVGAAVVELTFVLPVLMILVFGSIELCQRLYVKQSSLIAAYEGCRLATRQNSTTAEVITQVQTLLDQQGIDYQWVAVRNITQGVNNIDEVVTGEEIRVRVRVNWAPNVISRYVIEEQGHFTISAHMLRE